MNVRALILAVVTASSVVMVDAASGVQDTSLARWTAAWQRGQPVAEPAASRCAAELAAEFVRARGDAGAAALVRQTALDWLALAAQQGCRDPWRRRTGARRGSEGPIEALVGAAEGALGADRGASEWVISEVLPGDARHPLSRRHAALRWAIERDAPGLSVALLVLGRRERDPLRPAALTALARWAGAHGADEQVDVFLVSLLARDGAVDVYPQPFGLLQQRLAIDPAPLAPRAIEVLRGRVELMLRARDWRQAARALQLLSGMNVDVRVPLLLDALALWAKRTESGIGSRRVVSDIVRLLEHESGRQLGSNPGNWITWWVAVRQGRIELKERVAADSPKAAHTPHGDADPRSRASFFGLRPTSDRVTFVLDHSGSMSTALGTRSISRYDEAISQMVRYLQASGTDTRFNVILFDSDTLRSSAELVVASPENVELARASLLSRPPEGGTCLEPAVRLALCVGANGEVDMDALTADTIIVLCDGENVEGHLWVAPLLARVQVEAQVRFHCVQVGGSGGRALRELAALSGGEFIRVDG